MSELALLEYGKPFGTQRFLKRAPQHTQDIWEREEIAPRAIDREVACSLPVSYTHLTLSKKFGIETPIIQAVNQVLFENKNPKQAVDELMQRMKKDELAPDLWER